MHATATHPTAAAAHDYFTQKMNFTTGPVELSRELKAGTMVIVDVRAAEDYRKGHVPGAINIPHNKWDKPQGLSRDKVNLLYCYSQVCHLAASAATKWTDLGYSVKELEGGFEAWQHHDLPIETSAGTTGGKVERSPSQENL